VRKWNLFNLHKPCKDPDATIAKIMSEQIYIIVCNCTYTYYV